MDEKKKIENKKEKIENKKEKIENKKEKIENIIFYVGIAIFAISVWYVSYNLGVDYFKVENIPIGQEYSVKDINMVENSSFVIVYYDNDENHSERSIIPSDYNIFNFTESNVTMPVMRLENKSGMINYWNVYIPKR